MAEGKTETVTTKARKSDEESGTPSPFTPTSTDDVRRLGSQPVGLEPQGDVVAMVSRDVDGNPRQSKNFTVLVPEGVSDEVRDAHWNRSGEAQGAKHLSGGAKEEPPVLGPAGFSDEEYQQRSEREHRELYRHNFREDPR